MPIDLPVDSILPVVLQELARHPIVVVQAAPGSGKTTRVAPALLDHYAIDGKKILLLQPRRIAVQNVALRIAEELNCPLGERVGYAIRFDSKFQRQTQLLIVTEGILRRMLSDDITLADISVVVFDEFHERSLDSDLLFAMCRHLQATICPDLRIVIMSATIATDFLNTQLNGAPVLNADGQMYPVDIRYSPFNARDRLASAVAQTTVSAVARHAGDVLVFLPGKGEIHQTEAILSSQLPKEVEILPLYGTMPIEQQQYATRGGTSPNARRRIILSTNIAETSLTIENVRVVIDSGLARVLRYDPASGLDRLSLEPICRASADQRAGRAGRVAPGTVYRMWSEQSQRARVPYLEPEIHRIDFTSALLQLHAWDEPNVDQLPWLEAPRENTLQAAQKLLEQLGATTDGKLTELGTRMARLPIHPRLARLVLEGKRCPSLIQQPGRQRFFQNEIRLSSQTTHQILGTVLLTAGLLDCLRDASVPAQQPRRWPCDVCEKLEAIAEYQSGGNPVTKFGEIHRNGLQTIAKVASQIAKECFAGASTSDAMDENTGQRLRQSLLAAFPDRVARRRAAGQDRALMVGSKGVKLAQESGVVHHEFFLCLDAEASGADATIRTASGIERSWLAGSNIRVVDELFYSPTHKAVQCRRRVYWLDLVLEESPATISDRSQAAAILAKAAIAQWARSYPQDDRDLQNLIGRINLLAEYCPDLELQKVTTERLHQICESICLNTTSLDQIKNADWGSYLAGSLNPQQASALHQLCPAKVSVSGGRQIAIDYTQAQPILPVKIQDAFGMRQNPRILQGKVVVQMHLLAPNMRTQQITNDLASFWQNGYPVAKKELKRRYAKHAWPDDPLNV